MARIVENDKGFKVIALSIEDILTLDWGTVCMHCNGSTAEEAYYIAVSHDTMCKDCYEKWVKTAKRYPEDIRYENRQFDYIKHLLNL